MNIALLCLCGLAAGVMSGALGVGGGFILVPVLVYFLRQDMHTAIGTSLTIIVPTALVGALWHIHSGNVNFKLMWVIALCAVVGGFCGAYLTHYLSAAVLRKIFAVLLFIVAVKMFIK